MGKLIELLNILSPTLQGDYVSSFLGFLQTYKDHITNKNLEETLIKLETKINSSLLNGNLPELNNEDSNLMLSFLEEMKFIYTIEKQECITNLITNMLYEKRNGQFELYTYQVVFEQLKQMYDPEILLFKEIHSKNETLTCYKDNDVHFLSSQELTSLDEYSTYKVKRLENLAFLEKGTGFVAVDSNGEFIYNQTYFNTFYNKACTLLYEE